MYMYMCMYMYTVYTCTCVLYLYRSGCIIIHVHMYMYSSSVLYMYMYYTVVYYTCTGVGALLSCCNQLTVTPVNAGWNALHNWSLIFLSQRDFFCTSKNSSHPPPTCAIERRKWRLAEELNRRQYRNQSY